MNSISCQVLCGPMLLKCHVTQDYSVFIICIINIIVFYFIESRIKLICLLHEEIKGTKVPNLAAVSKSFINAMPA